MTYRPVDPEVSQGDIIDGVPHLRLRPPLAVIREVTLRGSRRSWAPYPYPPVEGQTPDSKTPGKTIILEPFHVKQGEYVPVLAQFTRAIILSYDCDLAHEEDFCLIAIVRPMEAVQEEEDRQTIRNGRNFSHFYLPAHEGFCLAEAYADFRRITTLDPDILDLGARKASLTPQGVAHLHAHLFRFLTRRDLAALPPAPQPS